MDLDQGPLKPVTPIDVSREVEPLPPADPISSQQNLVSLASELEYFTTALLFTHGAFDQDPLVLFAHEYPQHPQPFTIDCETPFFQDIPLLDSTGRFLHWNHRLYAIRKEAWHDCCERIARTAVTSQPHRFFCSLLYNKVRIVDPVSLRQRPALTELPMIDVTVFAVNSNRGFVHLREPINPWRSRAFPEVLSARPETLVQAAALLKHFAG